jgi:hypothetical protein
VESFHVSDYTNPPIDCGDFYAVERGALDVKFTTFVDGHDNPVRLQAHVSFDGTMSNSKSGMSVRNRWVYKRIYDFEDETHTVVGVLYAITIPGQGIVVQDMGRIVFDAIPWMDPVWSVLWQAGPHEWIEGGDAVICTALE